MPQRIEVPGMGVVEFPDGMSDDQIAAAIKANMPKSSAAKPSGFLTGLADQIHGGAQLLTNLLPRDVVEAGNRLNNWLADKTGLVAKLPEGGVDQAVREREAAYQAGRGSDGMDWSRLAGNVLSPVGLGLGGAMGNLAPMATNLASRAALGATAGGTAGAMMPATGEDFANEKLSQILVGGAGGAAVPAAMAGLGRLVSPKASTNPQLALLQREGVRPTVGQTLGGAAARAEEKAMSVPLFGGAIRDARTRAIEDMNRAVANRALAPIGQKPAADAVGRELVADVHGKLSQAYDDILPKLTWRPDGQFAQQTLGLRQMMQTGAIKPEAREAFDRILSAEVVGKMGAQNAMTGQTFKAVESNLGNHVRRLAAAQDADQRLLGNAVAELRSALRGALQRSNPASRELAKINEGWANFKRLERAAGYVGAEDGIFSAANLQSAVKALDRSKDHGRFARGDALMQDLSDASKSVLGAKVPDSGTAGRVMNAATIASGVHNPLIPLSLYAGGKTLYSAPMQSLLRSAVASRPAVAEPVADLMNQTAPLFGPLGGLLGLEVLKQ